MTRTGINSTIFGMNFDANSMRAGGDRPPRIGPMTRPHEEINRVQIPPPATWVQHQRPA
jgi:hypothetical protein